MTKDLTPKSLAERIAEKRAEEEAIWESYREGMQERVKSAFERAERESVSYGSKLSASVGAEVERTRSAIAEDLRALRSGFARKMLWSLTIGFLIVCGAAAGVKSLVSYLSWDIQRKIETRAGLTREIEEQQWTVERLSETTWDVVLFESNEGRKFVVLPPGTLEDPPLIVGGRPYVELSSE